ncbi:MAG: tetratricopeptide repeat protein [Steroidobacteraceae bacterium]
MRRLLLPVAISAILAAGCAGNPPVKETLGELRSAKPDIEDVTVENGLEKAMLAYRRFLDETPGSELTPDAMRRLADLQVEHQFGIHGPGEAAPEMAAPEMAAPERAEVVSAPLEAIRLYESLLTEYPGYEHNDDVLYQMARAYDELGETEQAMATMDRLVGDHAYSGRYDEVQYRRGDFFFTRKQYREAEAAYNAVIAVGTDSSYHELALYKLGWALYKQDFYEEALHQYTALLDFKLAAGYDFDHHQSEDEERRIADTFRAISLSFSYLGGAEVVQEYFGEFGNRGYEDRIYGNLGEHYLEKQRYQDAAKALRTFEDIYPNHPQSPRFGMRVVDVFTQGGFPLLVLESKKEFAGRYGVQSGYWAHNDRAASGEVLSFLKTNLRDLANHYHAQYQDPELADERLAHYGEARRWYGEFLGSFPSEEESPTINYRLADLLLENSDFGDAAREYERTAYDYPAHDKSSAAGYAAVYAHRQDLKSATGEASETIRRATVESSLRFADAFPQHEHAAQVLGAAADDLYGMGERGRARDVAQRVVDSYLAANPGIRRSAWAVVAHSSFELNDFARAEGAYAETLALTGTEDAGRSDLVENYAASIYKQGELASEAADYRAAANHFLRIREVAPASTIRVAADYDAGAALVKLEDWSAAAVVFDEFRQAHPEHELAREATKQVAYSHRANGDLGTAAAEYGRVAAESTDPAVRAEALLVAGDLYEQAGQAPAALAVYREYVGEFASPVETAVETRGKMAAIHQAAGDSASYYSELESIVAADAAAGEARTARTRTLAGRSALVLSEKLYGEFAAVRLMQPFEASLERKQALMDALIGRLSALVDYELAEVTAAATFYLAETYLRFSEALMASERPGDLSAAELADYELVLEEEAFPFEERAIAMHEQNLALLHDGVYNSWTTQSLGQLAGLVPGRYARGEMSAGVLSSIETYAYQTPAAAEAARLAALNELLAKGEGSETP